jgi:hypothetical protein
MDKIIIGNMELSKYTNKDGTDIYSLISVRKFNEKYIQNWCRLELGAKGLSEKSQPMKVVLGTKDEAIVALAQLTAILQADAIKQDIPF